MPGVRNGKRSSRKQNRRGDVHVSEVRLAGDGAHTERGARDLGASDPAESAGDVGAGLELNLPELGAGAGSRDGISQESLVSEARDLDGHARAAERDPGGARAAEVLPPADFAAEGRELVDVLADALGDWFPSTRPIYNEERRARLAKRTEAVLRKHNLSAAVIFGRWGPEIMLAAAASSAIKPTYDAIAYDMKHPPAAEPPVRSSEPPPASHDVPPGQAPDPFSGRKI